MNHINGIMNRPIDPDLDDRPNVHAMDIDTLRRCLLATSRDIAEERTENRRLRSSGESALMLLQIRVLKLKAELESTTKEFNERLVDRTTGMLDSLAKPRLSAASFRAGWEASMDFATGGTNNLEQSLREHLEP